MSVIETMGRAICATGNVPGFKCTCPLFGEPAGNDWCNGNRAPAQARAALRAVKPSDISDAMVEAFCVADETCKAGTEFADAMKDNIRRAISAAIAAGA